MKKEPYVKPTVKSEILKADVLHNCGSGCGNDNHGCNWPWLKPS